MTTNIEEQFFKWAGVEQKYEDRCALEDRCKEQGLPFSEVEKRCPHKMQCTDFCEDAYTAGKYPHITPSIILELEEILLKHTEGFELLINEHHRYAYIATIYSNGEYWRLHSSDEIRHNALLELLIEVSDTNIKLQVEKLFRKD